MDKESFKKGDIVYVPNLPEIDFSGRFLITGGNKDFYHLKSIEEEYPKTYELEKEFAFILMKVNVYDLSMERFHDLLTYKVSWHDIFGEDSPETVLVNIPSKVALTLDDLITALTKADKQAENKDPRYYNAVSITLLFHFLGLHFSSLFLNSIVATPSYTLAPFSEDAAIMKLFAKADTLCDVSMDLFKKSDIATLLSYAIYLKSIVDKPLIERPLNDEDAANLILYYDNVGHHESLAHNPEAKEAFLHFLNELEKKNNPPALAVLGDDYFTGSLLFPKDYSKAIPYFERLSHLNNYLADVRLGEANLLGLGGLKIDYDKAFKFFSIAAMGGSTIATFRVADMMEKGLEIPKDPKLAFDLVNAQKKFELQSLLGGSFTSFFPDIAYRLGHYLFNGIGCEENAKEGLGYLLEAQETFKLREASMDFSFDPELKKGIQDELLKALRLFPSKNEKGISKSDSPIVYFSQAFSLGYSVDATITRDSSMAVTLVISYHKDKGLPTPRFLAVDFKNMDARFADQVSIHFLLPPWAKADFVEEGKYHVDKVEDSNGLKAYYHGKNVFFIPYEEAVATIFEIKRSQKKIKLASLMTRDNDNEVFLAPQGPIKVGDIVDATFDNLPKSATVIRLFSINEDDSPLHEEDYETFSTHGA